MLGRVCLLICLWALVTGASDITRSVDSLPLRAHQKRLNRNSAELRRPQTIELIHSELVQINEYIFSYMTEDPNPPLFVDLKRRKLSSAKRVVWNVRQTISELSAIFNECIESKKAKEKTIQQLEKNKGHLYNIIKELGQLIKDERKNKTKSSKDDHKSDSKRKSHRDSYREKKSSQDDSNREKKSPSEDLLERANRALTRALTETFMVHQWVSIGFIPRLA
jgi:hypothetical protein